MRKTWMLDQRSHVSFTCERERGFEFGVRYSSYLLGSHYEYDYTVPDRPMIFFNDHVTEVVLHLLVWKIRLWLLRVTPNE